jgi:hypothetical protein
VIVGSKGFSSFVGFSCFVWVFVLLILVRSFMCILPVYLEAPYAFYKISITCQKK